MFLLNWGLRCTLISSSGAVYEIKLAGIACSLSLKSLFLKKMWETGSD